MIATKRWLALIVVALALFGSALAVAKPKAKQRHSQRRPKAKQPPATGSAAGSGSAGSGAAAAGAGSGTQATGSGSAATGADRPDPTSTPSGSASPPAGSASPTGSAAADPTFSPPALTPDTGAPPGLTRVEPPRKAPTLAMRPRASSAHGGFVDRMDCSACHTPDGWDLGMQAGKSGFDHDRTGFPLRGAHKQSDCGGCHTGTGKPPTTCEGCHEDVHRGRNTGTCAECHTATTWRDTNALDQHRGTRMPLTGRHATIDCVACHRRQSERQWSDVPTSCYACHRADYNGETHPTHNGTDGHRVFPRDCGMCHQTSAWSPALRDPTVGPFVSMRTVEHDAYFQLSTGSHRNADCASCHVDPRRKQAVRCDACHNEVTLRAQHRGAVSSRAATGCLACHPRGAAR